MLLCYCVTNNYVKKDIIVFFYYLCAERNAIYNSDVSLKGASCYVTMFPCADCCRAIIQTGMSEVVVEMPDWEDERWGESFKVSRDMFAEAGVKLTYIKLDEKE